MENVLQKSHQTWLIVLSRQLWNADLERLFFSLWGDSAVDAIVTLSSAFAACIFPRRTVDSFIVDARWHKSEYTPDKRNSKDLSQELNSRLVHYSRVTNQVAFVWSDIEFGGRCDNLCAKRALCGIFMCKSESFTIA
jgi:hypothetical protein